MYNSADLGGLGSNMKHFLNGKPSVVESDREYLMVPPEGQTEELFRVLDEAFE